MEPDRLTVEEIYGYGSVSPAEIDAALDRSRGPKSAESLYETFAVQGIVPEHLILDIGARDALNPEDWWSR